MNTTAKNKTTVMISGLTYFYWGLMPIFWKQLAPVSSTVTVFNRVLWSALFAGIVVFVFRRRKKEYLKISIKQLLTHLLSASLLGVNWLTYIWALQNNMVMQTSIAYFITPFVSFLLAAIILKEKLSLVKIVSMSIAFLGVLLLFFAQSTPPYIALFIAFNFGMYGFIKKSSRLASFESIFLEMLIILIPISFVYGPESIGVMKSVDVSMLALLALTGPLTVMPLFFFNYAVQRVPLFIVAVLQFITPTVEFLLARYMYNEPFDSITQYSMSLIWFGVMILLGSSGLSSFKASRPIRCENN